MILIVDDDDMVRTVTARMLEHVGFAVITAANGAEAIELFQEHAGRIELVILDVSMPVMGGAEAFLKIRALRADAVIAFSTGMSDEDDTRGVANLKPNGYISKPYEMGSLLASVRGILGANGRSPAP